jgi:hypothetical protein
MAYQRVDLRPFTPNGFHAIEVQRREMMTRSILRSTQVTNEDFAIVSIHHIPGNVLSFDAMWDVVQEFLEEHINIRGS